MKVSKISGCKDCPYRFEWHDLIDYCGYKNAENPIEVDPESETPHPDCKLPDLPDEADILYFASSVSATVKMARIDGANYVIEKITK